MTTNALYSSDSVGSTKRVDLPEALLRLALLTGERYVNEFSQIAALVRVIEQHYPPSPDLAQLLSLLESVTSASEANARLDVELFGGLLAGRLARSKTMRRGRFVSC